MLLAGPSDGIHWCGLLYKWGSAHLPVSLQNQGSARCLFKFAIHMDRFWEQKPSDSTARETSDPNHTRLGRSWPTPEDRWLHSYQSFLLTGCVSDVSPQPWPRLNRSPGLVAEDGIVKLNLLRTRWMYGGCSSTLMQNLFCHVPEGKPSKAPSARRPQ